MRTLTTSMRFLAVVATLGLAVLMTADPRRSDAAGEMLRLDFNISDGACVDIDGAASVTLSSSFQVGVCLTNPPAQSIAAFRYRVTYDDRLLRVPEIADSGTALDDNPDANVGATTFTSPTYPAGLGSGWDCSSGVGAYPKGDADGATGDGDGTAFSGACISFLGPYGLMQGPLGVITFETVLAGNASLAIAAASVTDANASQIGSCNPTEVVAMTCAGGTVSVVGGNSTISGKVYVNSVAPANVFSGALIDANGIGGVVSDSTGTYVLSGLPADTYTVTATPPPHMGSANVGPVALAAGSTVSGQDIIVTGPPGVISGTVYHDSVSPPNVLAGASVQACSAAPLCLSATTDGSGVYSIPYLPDGSYTVTAYPSGSYLNAFIGPVVVSGGVTSGHHIVVFPPVTPPPGTISPSSGNSAEPTVHWDNPLTLTRTGCPGGAATYQMTQGATIIRLGSMTESPAGTYTAYVAPLNPAHGQTHVAIVIDCPSSGDETLDFEIYIDPSGFVRTVAGDPIVGATVVLYRSFSPFGPFTQVPNGSSIMSFANRTNPDLTDGAGHFGWDVIAGYYKVRASKGGCISPTDATVGFTESYVMTIPPPVTDLDLRLDCSTPPCNPGDPLIANTDNTPLDNGPQVPNDDATLLKSDADNNSCDGDDDNDGLVDASEGTYPIPGCASATAPTSALLIDTDGDGLTDGWECDALHPSDPTNRLSKNLGSSAPDPDVDDDRIPDLWEARGYAASGGATDSDIDGCHDLVEAASIDGNKAIQDADRLAVARRSLNVYGPEVRQDYVLDIDKNGTVGDADRLFVARATLLSDWQPKTCP